MNKLNAVTYVEAARSGIKWEDTFCICFADDINLTTESRKQCRNRQTACTKAVPVWVQTKGGKEQR